MEPIDFRKWRRQLGMSQKDAAHALGLKRRMIQYYEKGEREGEKVKIPLSVRLACFAISEGVIDYHGPGRKIHRRDPPKGGGKDAGKQVDKDAGKESGKESAKDDARDVAKNGAGEAAKDEIPISPAVAAAAEDEPSRQSSKEPANDSLKAAGKVDPKAEPKPGHRADAKAGQKEDAKDSAKAGRGDGAKDSAPPKGKKSDSQKVGKGGGGAPAKSK
ncbi:MAG: helix-turn-helix domain-containing protein [Alphaproteobacteria bacterium]|nr:helix-turn-helix domain-containing protein [Alphaproteobacteria bacterium]